MGVLDALDRLIHNDETTLYQPFGTPQAMGVPGHGQRSVITTGKSETDAVLEVLSAMYLEMRRQGRADFNNANPVDEGQSSTSAFAGPVTIARQYDLPERIESITVSLPIGITGAVLQLGQNFIPLLQAGAATTVQTLLNFTGLGIILSPGDVRQLTFTGAPTSGYGVFLAGHVLEREGAR